MSVKNIYSSALVKKRITHIAVNILRYIMLIVIGYIVLYPLLYMISNSLKPIKALLDVRFIWVPRYASMDAIKQAFEYLDFYNAFSKTLFIQIVSALIQVFVCAFVAYGFSRFKFKGQKIATFFLVLSLTIPLSMYGMSLSVNYRQLGIFGTYWCYWLPSLFGVGIRSGMIIYIYIQFFKGLPRELEDAAYVDGAGPIRTFLQIALPSSGVVIVTVTVLSIVWHWNESYLSSLCFSDDKRPLAVMISQIEIPLHQDGLYLQDDPYAKTLVFAGCLLFIIIPLIVYLILQRKFVKSIDRVGITG